MIVRTDPHRIVEKLSQPTAATDTVSCGAGDAVILMRQGQITNVAGPGQYTVPDAGLEVYYVRTEPVRQLRGGGVAGTIVDGRSRAPVSPRVIMEYDVRVSSPSAFLVGMVGTGSFDDDALRSWVNKQIMSGVKIELPAMSILDALENASALAERVRASANTTLAGMGLEITKLDLRVNLSDDDIAAIRKQ